MKTTCLMLLSLVAIAHASEGKLTVTQDSALVWESGVGRAVRFNAPQLTVEDPEDHS